MSIKMVCVMRKDLKMRRGKEIAQGGHAFMAWLTLKIRTFSNMKAGDILSPEEREWVEGRFTKICLQVDSEKELLAVYGGAREAGLTAHLITDAGLTEFHGIETVTCVGIGPHKAEKIDAITGHLKLY